MAGHLSEIEGLGGHLWAISPQDQINNKNLADRRSLPFPILADSSQEVIKEWGLFNYNDLKGRAIPYPATYIIDRNGVIAWSYIGISTRDRPLASEVINQMTIAAKVKKE